MNYTLVLLVVALIMLFMYKNMNNMSLPDPESLQAMAGEMLSGETVQVSSEMANRGSAPTPYMAEEQSYMPMVMQEEPQIAASVNVQVQQVQQDELIGANGVGEYGEFPPTDKVYFKPHGAMGDAASSNAGIITSAQAAAAHPVDNCNRFYCEGCGPSSCQGNNSYADTDDIRRDYTGLITTIRSKRNNEYPFYILS